MASVFELANLSAMAYDATQLLYGNWRRSAFHGIPSGKGFYAELYTHSKKREAVMAIRGTDFDNKDVSDFQSDIQLALGATPAQFASALTAFDEFVLQIKRELRNDFQLYLTGHSLGGGLAALLSAKKAGLPTVTFNAPGMQRSFIGGHVINLIGYINLQYVDTSQMLHIRATGDPVSVGTGKHMGKVEEVYVDNWGDGKVIGASRHLAQHSIKNMVSTLQRLPHYSKDLGFKKRLV